MRDAKRTHIESNRSESFNYLSPNAIYSFFCVVRCRTSVVTNLTRRESGRQYVRMCFFADERSRARPVFTCINHPAPRRRFPFPSGREPLIERGTPADADVARLHRRPSRRRLKSNLVVKSWP